MTVIEYDAEFWNLIYAYEYGVIPLCDALELLRKLNRRKDNGKS